MIGLGKTALRIWQEIKRAVLAKVNREARIGRGLWLSFFFLAFTWLFSSYFFNQHLELRAGQIAPYTVLAPRQVVDPVMMTRLEQQAAASVAPFYVNNPDAIPIARSLLENCFGRLAAGGPTGSTLGMAGKVLQNACGVVLPDKVAAAILAKSKGQLATDENEGQGALTAVMQMSIHPGPSLVLARDQVGPQILSQGVAGNDAVFLDALVQWLVQPNQILDAGTTKKLQLEAMAAVPPHYLLRGQLIVGKGDRVSADDFKRLKAIGFTPGMNFAFILGAGFLTLVFFAVVWFYLNRYQREALASDSFLIMIGLISLLTFLVAKLLGGISPYLIPLAASTMLLTILADGRLAILLGFLYLMGIALTVGMQVPGLLTLAAGSLAGAFTVSKASQRGDLMLAGLYVVGANLITNLATAFLSGSIIPNADAWANLAWSGVGGISASVITIGSLPFFETFFGILTPMKLLELSNPNQPLLRELLLKAPGTYHHSLMVANLAEAGAQAVGADSLLARVGAYYHDVGKARRPYFFIDNQFGSKNPHDRITPTLSTLVVMSHVKDGIQMARQRKLPQKIMNFIAEHHGTTLVRYFYTRAEELGRRGKKQGQPREDDFRYEGPKPRSMETAIVMLADSTEAAVRSMKDPLPGHVEATVRRVIQERLHDGQLDESSLTLKELDTLVRVFAHLLLGMWHQRVEYPALGGSGPANRVASE